MRGFRYQATAIVVALAACVACASCKPGSPWLLSYQAGNYSLTSITAADASHVWTIGAGHVFFFDGNDWARQADLPGDVSSISAGDATHVWASGAAGSLQAGAPLGGVIYFYDGSKWNKQFESGDRSIDVVAAHGAKNAWAAGWTGSGGNLYHFDGNAWSPAGAVGHVQDIRVLGDNKALLVQESQDRSSQVIVFDGKSWSSFYTAGTTRLGITTAGLSAIWTVGGSAGKGESSIEKMSWSKTGPITTFNVPDFLTKVAAADTSHVWAVGGTGYQGPIYFFDGKTWARQYAGGEPLFSVCATGPKKAWACGSLGAIYSYSPGGR